MDAGWSQFYEWFARYKSIFWNRLRSDWDSSYRLCHLIFRLLWRCTRSQKFIAFRKKIFWIKLFFLIIDDFISFLKLNFYFLQYFVFVFLVFVVMLVGAILGYVFREKVVQTMRQEMYSSLPLYGNRRGSEFWFFNMKISISLNNKITTIFFVFSNIGLGRNTNTPEMLWHWIVSWLVWKHTRIMLSRNIWRTKKTMHRCSISAHTSR